jgi:anaerobic C4-dicarboxylate transporter DcuA
MIWLELLVVLAAIFLGARLGSIAIGMAGGLGVLVLGAMKVPIAFADIPFDVIGIIMSVIAAIAAMQMAGGLDWLVAWADRLLRKNPKRITLYAPIITYLMTLLAGTGHTAFSTLPVIAEVAKENGVRPSRPLSISVVSSQIAITASPVSAAVVFMADQLEPRGIGYLQLLAVSIPSSLIAVIAISFLANMLGKPLDQDPEYQRRLAAGQVKLRGAVKYDAPPGALASVFIFLAGIICVMLYATLISPSVGLIAEPWLPRTEAIMAMMLTVATVIVLIGKFDTAKVLTMSTFRSGMSACVCVLGVAWLGTTFVNHNQEAIMNLAGNVLESQPWLLAVVLFFASALLYSQAATAKALMPTAFALGVSPLAAVASFAAVSGLFILPTYPTLIAAVEMDDTGSTRIGKFIFNHPFIIPGTLTIAASVALAFGFGALIL